VGKSCWVNGGAKSKRKGVYDFWKGRRRIIEIIKKKKNWEGDKTPVKKNDSQKECKR